MRNKCKECPFLEGSKTSSKLEGWLSVLIESDKPHGCHMLEDVYDPKKENVCIGHKEYLENLKDIGG